MAVEIERRFLVPAGAFEPPAAGGTPVRQGYLTTAPPLCVRVRLTPQGCWLSLKEAVARATRAEFEYPIPRQDAERILELCGERVVEKTRYRIPWADHLWDVDVFGGANDGLVLAEVELEREDEPVRLPPWVGREVTGEARYANAALAERPWRSWPAEERG